MANANWNGGKGKGRAQAYARLRHNDPERRADSQVEHANREIDKSRTRLNFEVGPTAGMTYDEKRVRLDAILDKYGYPSDEDVKRITKNTPTRLPQARRHRDARRIRSAAGLHHRQQF